MQSLINELSALLEQPGFQPHLTLLGDLALPEKTLAHRTRQALAASPIINARIVAIGYFAEFFRSFFLRLEDHPAILDLYQKSCSLIGSTPGPGFMPHISLAYGNIEPATKMDWHARLNSTVTHRAVCFDRLALIYSSKTIPIDQWTVLEIFPLRQPTS